MIDKMDFNKHFEGKVAWRHYRESPWGLVPEQSVLLSWHRRENHFFMKTSILLSSFKLKCRRFFEVSIE